MVGLAAGEITPSVAGNGYCRIAYLDSRRRFLAGDPAIAEHVSDWDSGRSGVIDAGAGMIVMEVGGAESVGRLSAPPGAAYVIARFDSAVLRARTAEIGRSYGLTSRQIGLLEALIRLGGIREAAETTGMAYTAARNMLAEIKAKTGFNALAPMVGHMLELISGTSAHPEDAVDHHDLFGLSDRQFAIACGMATASSRRELADRLGLSEAVVKAELKDIFLTLGVENAGQLARVGVEARLSIAMMAMDAGAAHLPNVLPDAWMVDGDGRTIGWSDYGPAGARPVFILHSTITARAPPTRLVAALHDAGFRPIAIDRPGFGGTSPAPSGGDLHHTAARDFEQVCAALGIEKADIVARGSGQAAIMLAHYAGALIGRAVLVNPTPHIDFTSVDRGPLGAVKRRFVKNPMIAEAMIRLLCAFATPRRMREGMIRSFRGSAPDEAVIDDPQFIADYLRAIRGFADGRIAGYVAEQVAWARGSDVPPLPDMRHWRIVQGAHFVLHDPKEALAYWRTVLPDTLVTMVADAGQMLAYSHPGNVVAALLD